MLILSVGNAVHAAAHNYLYETRRSYFTVKLIDGYIESFIPVLDNETKIKFRYKNKTYMLYKQADLKYSIVNERANNSFDSSNKTFHWMGIYYEENNTFYYNPFYRGNMLLSDIINMIRL
jgi:hypothetical protein